MTNLPQIGLKDWLTLERSELAAIVRRQHLSVMFSIDGTTRYFLIDRYRQAVQSQNDVAKIFGFDFDSYTSFVEPHLRRVFELLFLLGVENVMNPVLLPQNFDRSAIYAQQVVAHSHKIFRGSTFTDMYASQGLRVHAFGDYDVSERAQPVRQQLGELERGFEALNATHLADTVAPPQTLWLGYHAESYTQEIIKRTSLMRDGQLSDERLLAECFRQIPYAPRVINLLICAGWLRVGGILPPLLDNGQTDIYNMAGLILDMQEETMRRILYDHLYLRTAWSDGEQNYSPADIAKLARHQELHGNCLIGLGKLEGPGIWYAEHKHS